MTVTVGAFAGNGKEGYSIMKLSVILLLTTLVTVELDAQVRYSVSTDSSMYRYGDSIRVSIEVINPLDSAYALGLSYCDVTYFIDGVNVKAHVPCPLVIVNYNIPPHDSLNLGPLFLPPFPVTDTISQGSHVILGMVNGYLIPDSIRINVVTSAEAFADAHFPLGIGDYWQYVVHSSDSEAPFTRDSSAYSLEVLGDTTMPNGSDYRKILYKPIYPSGDSSLDFERLDPMRASVYKYDTAGPSDEVQIDSLMSQPGDTSRCLSDIPNSVFPSSFYTSICSSTMSETVFGMATSVKEFSGSNSVLIAFTRYLASGLGVVNASYGYDFGVTGISLVYARLSGAEYGTKIVLGVQTGPRAPETFKLYQNYPNPFNPTTVIKFEVRGSGLVSLKVYNVLGQLVKTLVDKVESPGSHAVTFDAAGLASGVYFYRLAAGSYVMTKKMLLLK